MIPGFIARVYGSIAIKGEKLAFFFKYSKFALFTAKNRVFRKKSATVPGSVLEIKRF
jgi:hypothetical protein